MRMSGIRTSGTRTTRGPGVYDLANLKISEYHLYYEMDFKNFCNPKMILKILVIPIQFQNRFQTIEV